LEKNKVGENEVVETEASEIDTSLEQFDEFLKFLDKFIGNFNAISDFTERSITEFFEFLTEIRDELRRKRTVNGGIRFMESCGFLPPRAKLIEIIFQYLLENLEECRKLNFEGQFNIENLDERMKLFTMAKMELIRYVRYNSVLTFLLPNYPQVSDSCVLRSIKEKNNDGGNQNYDSKDN